MLIPQFSPANRYYTTLFTHMYWFSTCMSLYFSWLWLHVHYTYKRLPNEFLWAIIIWCYIVLYCIINTVYYCSIFRDTVLPLGGGLPTIVIIKHCFALCYQHGILTVMLNQSKIYFHKLILMEYHFVKKVSKYLTTFRTPSYIWIVIGF